MDAINCNELAWRIENQDWEPLLGARGQLQGLDLLTTKKEMVSIYCNIAAPPSLEECRMKFDDVIPMLCY